MRRTRSTVCTAQEDAATKKGKKGARAAARLETAKELLRAGPPPRAVGALAPYLPSADDAKQLQRSPLKRLEGAALKARDSSRFLEIPRECPRSLEGAAVKARG